MRADFDELAVLRTAYSERLRTALRVASVVLLIVLVALQRGGYYAESWGLPTVLCAWAVTLGALLGTRQRLRPLEIAQLAGLTLLGVLTLASALWTPGGLGSALPEVELLALYASVSAAVLLVFRRATPLVGATWGALVAIALLSLGTRLFPSGASVDPASDNRLYEPLGYWNSLGLWAAMGVCLSAGLAARSRSRALQLIAAAACVPCAVTLYFTFGRGAWLALAIGIAVALVLDPRRLGLAAWLAALSPWTVAGVWLTSRAPALTSLQPVLAEARMEGRTLALELVALSVGSAATGALLAWAEQSMTIPRAARRAFAGVLLSVLTLGLATTLVHFGPPWTIVEKATSRFEAPPTGVSNLNDRLLDLSGNARIDLWRVAWRDAEANPIAGSGAGSYAAVWFRHRPNRVQVDNAHELYLETLAELGPLGLTLLLIALGAPLVGAWRARRHPLAAGATAAYVAFLVHVAADWDWQIAAVSLAALACGSALLVMARGARSPALSPRSRVATAMFGVALAGFAMWSLYGNYALGQARDALGQGEWSAAQKHAAVAASRMGGFSSLSWQLLGEAQTAERETGAARTSLRLAVRRDPDSWQAWYDLGVVTRGSERRNAAREALRLNPLGPETQSLARAAKITPPSP